MKSNEGYEKILQLIHDYFSNRKERIIGNPIDLEDLIWEIEKTAEKHLKRSETT